VTRRRTNLFALIAWLASSHPLWACSVCYGDTSSAMSDGLTWAITLMVGVVAVVLGGVVAFFVQTARKSAALPSPEHLKNQI